MKLTLKQILLFSSLFICAAAFGQDSIPLFDYSKSAEYEIGDVNVIGAKFLDSKILGTLSGLTKGEKIKIPGDQIPKAIKALWKQKLFTNITITAAKIENGKVYLVIKVEERPRIGGYSLKGIKTSDADDIKKKIDLRLGSIFTENMRSLTINAIKSYFIDKGFLSVNVTITEFKDSSLANSVKLRITVDRGNKLYGQYNIFR